MDVYKVEAPAIKRRYVVEADAATYISVHPDTLKKYREQKLGPPYIPFSYKKVLYDLEDLDKWLAKRKVTPQPTFDAFKSLFGEFLNETDRVE